MRETFIPRLVKLGAHLEARTDGTWNTPFTLAVGQAAGNLSQVLFDAGADKNCTESLGRLFSTYFLFLVFILFVFYASILKIGNGRYEFAGVEVGLPSDTVGLKSVLKTKYTMANSSNEQTNEIVIQYVLTAAAFPKLINA